jgi:hypothetical protein
VSRRHARTLAAVLAAALAAITGVTSAFAASTWTVRPGGTISLTSGGFTVTDTPTGTMILCSSTSLSGTLPGGSGHPGTGIGSITAGRIRYCGNLGMFTLTAGDLPWHLNFTSYNATARTVTGSISHLHIGVSEPGCRAVVDGTGGTAGDGIVRFTYTNGTATFKALTTGGNLHFYNVRGCAGLLRNGDKATVSGTFPVSPKQVITSP